MGATSGPEGLRRANLIFLSGLGFFSLPFRNRTARSIPFKSNLGTTCQEKVNEGNRCVQFGSTIVVRFATLAGQRFELCLNLWKAIRSAQRSSVLPASFHVWETPFLHLFILECRRTRTRMCEAGRSRRKKGPIFMDDMRCFMPGSVELLIRGGVPGRYRERYVHTHIYT